jgi:hypothetical protein
LNLLITSRTSESGRGNFLYLHHFFFEFFFLYSNPSQSSHSIHLGFYISLSIRLHTIVFCCAQTLLQSPPQDFCRHFRVIVLCLRHHNVAFVDPLKARYPVHDGSLGTSIRNQLGRRWATRASLGPDTARNKSMDDMYACFLLKIVSN